MMSNRGRQFRAGNRIAASLALVIPCYLCIAIGFAQTPAQTAQSAKLDAAKSDPLQLHKDQLAADSAKLVQLATELKIAVDKSTKDQLSLTVVKKADEVEKLARKVREEMKSTPAN